MTRPTPTREGPDWPVSSSSQFNDSIWLLDPRGASRYQARTHRVINWSIPLPDGSTFTDSVYAVQLRSCKLPFYLLQNEPAQGRRKWRNGTLRNVYSAVRLLLAWMVANGYRRFAELDYRATRQFAAHLRTRRGRRGELTPSALRHHLMLLVALYEHRKELPDAPLVHPLDGETETAYAGARGREGAPIPHIPDDIATYVIGAALIWVTTYAPTILEAERTVFDPALTVDAKSPSIACRRRRIAGRGLALASPIAWQGQTCSLLPDLRLLERFREHLVYACYIIIASHTGMRASEISAMQTDCLETTASDGGRPLLFVRSRLFKTAPDEDGVETRWVAGRDHARNPVRLAVQALIELRRIHVADATTAGLWAVAIGRWTAAARSYAAFSAWTNTFARTSGLPRPWTFSSHQFRKTFARWIVIHHKVDMLPLRDHFKHVSVVMTDQYVGDVELLELIGEAQIESAAYELGLCLNADRLAGAAGEELLRTNTRFRGEAGRPFAMEYAREMVGDGFIVLPNEYGICLYDAETARCHGDFARVGVETCLRCANAILGPQHLPFWRGLTADAAALRESIAAIPRAETAVAALDDRIVAFRTVVTKLEQESVAHDTD